MRAGAGKLDCQRHAHGLSGGRSGSFTSVGLSSTRRIALAPVIMRVESFLTTASQRLGGPREDGAVVGNQGHGARRSRFHRRQRRRSEPARLSSWSRLGRGCHAAIPAGFAQVGQDGELLGRVSARAQDLVEAGEHGRPGRVHSRERERAGGGRGARRGECLPLHAPRSRAGPTSSRSCSGPGAGSRRSSRRRPPWPVTNAVAIAGVIAHARASRRSTRPGWFYRRFRARSRARLGSRAGGRDRRTSSTMSAIRNNSKSNCSNWIRRRLR